ncbi:DUF72 domain-containing protein [bacterium]|nr:DUF72 domain-containing protein [bacterium]
MIIIGTSGYHFPDWSGAFYPPDLPKEQWLRYYAERFPAVEINMTYYALPKPEQVARWAQEVPEGFRFTVKLPGETTHKRERDGEEVSEFLPLLAPLRDRGMLVGVLGQFPASFHNEQGERDYLELVVERCGDVPLFVELRHISWDRDDTIEWLSRLGAHWVTVDQPALRGLSRPRPAATGGVGYVRFHGRNRKTWYNPKAGDRYDWDYEEEELKSWIPRLKAMEERAETSYLFFNNCHAGQAVRSAKLMKAMLAGELKVV